MLWDLQDQVDGGTQTEEVALLELLSKKVSERTRVQQSFDRRIPIDRRELIFDASPCKAIRPHAIEPTRVERHQSSARFSQPFLRLCNEFGEPIVETTTTRTRKDRLFLPKESAFLRG